MPARQRPLRTPERARSRPGPRPARPRGTTPDTREAIFEAAAQAFSELGFDGVTVDAIAARAGVNKAMLYYHFRDKLSLYREIVREMLREGGARMAAVAGRSARPGAKIRGFVGAFLELTDRRPWFPRLMLREMAEGAPHLDVETLAGFRGVFGPFSRILEEGQRAGAFRPVPPVLAYVSIIGPLLLNIARERAGSAPGRADLPMLAPVPRDQLRTHVERTALAMLARG